MVALRVSELLLVSEKEREKDHRSCEHWFPDVGQLRLYLSRAPGLLPEGKARKTPPSFGESYSNGSSSYYVTIKFTV